MITSSQTRRLGSRCSLIRSMKRPQEQTADRTSRPHRERYYPPARIRVFHHSGPEIPGSAREGKPRSFFLSAGSFQRPSITGSAPHFSESGIAAISWLNIGSGRSLNPIENWRCNFRAAWPRVPNFRKRHPAPSNRHGHKRGGPHELRCVLGVLALLIVACSRLAGPLRI